MALAGPESGCPEQFAACLTAEAGGALATSLRRSRSWEAEAWIRCGPPPDAGTPDGGP